MISVFSILIFWLVDFSVHSEEEKAAGCKRKACSLSWFSLPAACLANSWWPWWGCQWETGGRPGGSTGNHRPFILRMFPSTSLFAPSMVESALTYTGLARTKGKLAIKGMAEDTQGCRWAWRAVFYGSCAAIETETLYVSVCFPCK